jgi:4,5-dihydroxyphthalate decarboxylase
MALKLKFACGEYDRTIPFRTGDVKPKNIELEYTPQPPELTFLQQLKDQRYDVSEMSMSAYTQMRVKGRDDFIALPVFLTSISPHQHSASEKILIFGSPEQLRGKRVGIGFYQMSGAVWLRGALMDDYGVKPDEMIWVSGMDQKASAGADQVNQLADMVAGTRQSKPKLELMLESGEIDALVSVQTPRAMARNEGTVRYLSRTAEG